MKCGVNMKKKSILVKRGEKMGYDGKSYEQGFLDTFDDVYENCIINGLDIKGKIMAVLMNSDGILQYSVRYLLNGDFITNWLYDYEIEIYYLKKEGVENES